jgi:hypothetical protein
LSSAIGSSMGATVAEPSQACLASGRARKEPPAASRQSECPRERSRSPPLTPLRGRGASCRTRHLQILERAGIAILGAGRGTARPPGADRRDGTREAAQEVVGTGEILTTPDVPAGCIAFGRMPEAVDRLTG